MVKRFRQYKVVWLNYGTFLLQQGQSDAANALLQRALKSMPAKESKMAPPSTGYIVVLWGFVNFLFLKQSVFFSLHSVVKAFKPLLYCPICLPGVDMITKFAQLEFRYGDAERGRTMFDKVLTSYPKRTDLWSVFIDLMVKHGSQKDVR